MSNLTDVSAYQTIPYPSLPYFEAHPQHIAVCAYLHGLSPADPRTARILEIGCASGGHLIPIAFYQPDCHCVGIEPDPQQAARAQQLIRGAGIKNCRIINDFATLDSLADQAPFDYIILHGVFSWVNAATRAVLLKVISQKLSTTGVAYLSYNTLPGWHTRGQVRDLLDYTLKGLSDPLQRLQQARQTLKNFAQHIQGIEGLHRDYWQAELTRLQDLPDAYLYHEYLDSEQHAFRYDQVCDALLQHALHPITDADLTRLYRPPLPEQTLADLQAIANRQAREQQLDFLIHRHFRQTLISRHVGSEAQWERLVNLAWCGTLQALEPHTPKHQPSTYQTAEGVQVTVQHAVTKAAIQILRQLYPAAISYPVLIQLLGLRASDQEVEAQLFAELAVLFTEQALQVWGSADDPEPKAGSGLNRLTEAMLKQGWMHIVNSRHQTLMLTPEDRAQWLALLHQKSTKKPNPIANLAQHFGVYG